MPTFLWKGRTASGRVETGEMVAENQAEVLKALRTKKVIPVSVKPKPKEMSFALFGGKRLNTKELAIFTRQFATMINAGLALMDCLDTLKKQINKPGFRAVITEIMEDIEGGATLADALARQKRSFSNLYINMVAAGEAGGALDTILLRLATYLEKTAEIIRKIKGAMIYPAAIAIVTVGAVAILLIFVIPIFAKMYAEGWDGGLLQFSVPADPDYSIGWLVHFGPQPIVFYSSIQWDDNYHKLSNEVFRASNAMTKLAATKKMLEYVHKEAMIIPLSATGSSFIAQTYYHTNRFDQHMMVWHAYSDWMDKH